MELRNEVLETGEKPSCYRQRAGLSCVCILVLRGSKLGLKGGKLGYLAEDNPKQRVECVA